MRFGFHLSISGGLTLAISRGLRTGCEAAQIFSRNPRQWEAAPLDPEVADAFRLARIRSGLQPLAVHLPYLPNLAAEDDALWEKSIHVLAEEMERTSALGGDFVVAHPGHQGKDRRNTRSLDRIVEGIRRSMVGPATGRVRLVLENTAGQRGELGSRFEELAEIIAGVAPLPEVEVVPGVCLDTAHAWGAGYDLASRTGLDRTLAEFDRVLGLDRLYLIHLNDSIAECGTHRDRHAPVGRGRIGARAMARLVRHSALIHLAAIMETPRRTEQDDIENMARVKRWRRKNGHRLRSG